jgi:hypothetical protein
VNREQALEIWAPEDIPWGAWTKPTLFSFMPLSDPLPDPAAASQGGWVASLLPDAAVIVELPGAASVRVGLQLASCGYRPIPLFNACPFGLDDLATAVSRSGADFAPAVVDVLGVIRALERNTKALESLHLPPSAPPAFLLDANRSDGPLFPIAGMFDNRSILRESDLPTADFLKEHGIRQVILVRMANDLSRDVRPILLSWQAAGLQILAQRPGGEWIPQSYTVRRPRFLSILLDKLIMWLGFRTNSQGSFGRTVHAAGG